MHLHPDDAQEIRHEFARLTNLTQAELRAWLETSESRQVGWVRPSDRKAGDRESVGHRSGRRILEIRDTRVSDLSDADYAHMRKVIGYCRRHLAQRPAADRTGGDVTHTRWRWSLMNWGHDPLKASRR